MRKRLIYCDVCHFKVMPITDRDFNEGKAHVFNVTDTCEPSDIAPEEGIELIVRAQKVRISSTEYLGVNSVDLCRDCTEELLRKALGAEEGHQE